MSLFNKVREKFEDKGYPFIEFLKITNLFSYVELYIPSPQELKVYKTPSEALKNRQTLKENVHKFELEYWNTWIDYQKHK